jgi:hypothetical protein
MHLLHSSMFDRYYDVGDTSCSQLSVRSSALGVDICTTKGYSLKLSGTLEIRVIFTILEHIRAIFVYLIGDHLQLLWI